MLTSVVPVRSTAGRKLWCVGVAATAACATTRSAGPTPTEEPPDQVRREVVRGGGGPGLIEFHPDANRARVIDFRASADSLWPRVLAAYGSLGLPLGEVDTKAHLIGTSTVRALGRFGDARLGDYLDCGAAPLGVRAADSYVVLLRVITELKPQGPEPTVAAAGTTAPARSAPAQYTTVRTTVTATAKPNATQGDPVDCVSTGRLETRLVQLINPAPPAVPRR